MLIITGKVGNDFGSYGLLQRLGSIFGRFSMIGCQHSLAFTGSKWGLIGSVFYRYVSDFIINNYFNTDAICNLWGMDLDWDKLAKIRSNDTNTAKVWVSQPSTTLSRIPKVTYQYFKSDRDANSNYKGWKCLWQPMKHGHGYEDTTWTQTK